MSMGDQNRGARQCKSALATSAAVHDRVPPPGLCVLPAPGIVGLLDDGAVWPQHHVSNERWRPDVRHEPAHGWPAWGATPCSPGLPCLSPSACVDSTPPPGVAGRRRRTWPYGWRCRSQT